MYFALFSASKVKYACMLEDTHQNKYGRYTFWNGMHYKYSRVLRGGIEGYVFNGRFPCWLACIYCTHI